MFSDTYKNALPVKVFNYFIFSCKTKSHAARSEGGCERRGQHGMSRQTKRNDGNCKYSDLEFMLSHTPARLTANDAAGVCRCARAAGRHVQARRKTLPTKNARGEFCGVRALSSTASLESVSAKIK